MDSNRQKVGEEAKRTNEPGVQVSRARDVEFDN